MYLDSYVISSLIIVLLTIVVVGYIGWFGYRHIKLDMEKSLAGKTRSAKGT